MKDSAQTTSLGIDIGGTSVKLAMLHGTRQVWTGQSAFYSRPTTEQLIDAIKSAASGRETTAAVAGICVPGLLDRDARKITLSVNVPGLMGIVLDELVERSLGNRIGKIEIINDAVATATDVIDSHRLTGRVCSIALGTGVGMGILDDGVPLTIEGASPGHIGQVDCSIDDNPPIGPDGGAGSLEGYIGVPALVRTFGSMERFFQTVTVNDPCIRALTRAIRICHAIYRPRHFLLVGGVGTRLKHLIPEIHAAAKQNLTNVAYDGWTLSSGDHDFHAAMGAATLAWRAYVAGRSTN